MATKKDIIAEWKDKIRNNPRWCWRAALRLVELQTEEERNVRGTLDSNGVGLNSYDAEFVTDLVNQHMEGRRLTPKQLASLQRTMPKYAGQLYRLVFK